MAYGGQSTTFVTNTGQASAYYEIDRTPDLDGSTHPVSGHTKLDHVAVTAWKSMCHHMPSAQRGRKQIRGKPGPWFLYSCSVQQTSNKPPGII